MKSVLVEAKNALQNCSLITGHWRFLQTNEEEPIFEVESEVLHTFESLMNVAGLETSRTYAERSEHYEIYEIKVHRKVPDLIRVARTQALYWKAQNEASQAWVQYLKKRNDPSVSVDGLRYLMTEIQKAEAAVREYSKQLEDLGATRDILP